MPARELPVRRRYVVESLILSVTAARGLPTAVRQAITLPDTPAGEIGERDLIELITRLTGPATDAVQVLEELERRPGARPTTRPAKGRVKIKVRGQSCLRLQPGVPLPPSVSLTATEVATTQPANCSRRRRPSRRKGWLVHAGKRTSSATQPEARADAD